MSGLDDDLHCYYCLSTYFGWISLRYILRIQSKVNSTPASYQNQEGFDLSENMKYGM